MMVFGVVIAVFCGASIANASVTNFEGSLRKSETYKVNLSELSTLTTPRLDWRNPGFDIAFEIPTSDWIDNIELFLSVFAENRPNVSAPIYVQFNTAEPVPIYPRGQSFEARLNLDKSRVKSHRNTIRISFGAPDGCVDQMDGTWSIDLKDSMVVVKASTPSSPYYLRDVKQILESPLTTPKSVAIKAIGSERIKLESLAAQGIALNMPSLPRFSLATGSSDLELYIGTRQDLKSILKDTKIAKTEGPVIGVTRNAPLRLVLTGDNSKQVMKLVQAFATSELPPSRRSYAHSGEYSFQMPHAMSNQSVSGKKPIFELGSLVFDRGWGDNAQSIKFNVDNPLAAHGTAKLYFQKGRNASTDSTVNVQLNGKDLGTIKLANTRNVAKFDLPRGMLRGTNNVLSIKPELSPKDLAERCESDFYRPGFAVDARSYLDIKSEQSGFTGDLTRFAASGFPFSDNDGAKTTIVMATANNTERAAALRALAQLGKSYGTGWTEAKFIAKGQEIVAPKDHVLFLGSRVNAQAPRGLSAAIAGRLAPPKIIKTASLDTSNFNGPMVTLMSLREGGSVTGGIAALYADGDRVEGYLTNSRNHSFTRAMDNLVKPNNWNSLQGSMARWDRSSVEMTKTAFKSEIAQPAIPEVSKGLDLNLDLSWVKLPEIDLPKMNMPKFTVPDFLKTAKESDARIEMAEAPKVIEPKIITPKVKAPIIEAPKLATPKATKPNFKMPKLSMPSLSRPEPASPNIGQKELSGLTNIGQSWNYITAKLSVVLAPKPETTFTEPTPAPMQIKEDISDKSASNIDMPLAERFPPMPGLKPRPRLNLKPAPKLDNGYSRARPPQYDPGASLRGDSKKLKTVKTSQISSDLKSKINAAYSGSSNWASNVIDRSQPSQFKDETAPTRKPNMLLIAAVLALLLILFALASPKTNRD